MNFLTRQDIEIMNKLAIENYGGLYGIRDDTLLEGAIARPQNLYFYENAGIFELASCYAFAIAKNHPFLDGNKRIGAHAMLVFLALNEIETDYSQDDLINIIMGIASGQCNYADLLEWVRAHTILR